MYFPSLIFSLCLCKANCYLDFETHFFLVSQYLRNLNFYWFAKICTQTFFIWWGPFWIPSLKSIIVQSLFDSIRELQWDYLLHEQVVLSGALVHLQLEHGDIRDNTGQKGKIHAHTHTHTHTHTQTLKWHITNSQYLKKENLNLKHTGRASN